MKSLRTFVESKRDCFAEYESKGADISATTEYVQMRTRRQNVRLQPLDYGRGPASVLYMLQGGFGLATLFPSSINSESNCQKGLHHMN